MFPTLAENLSLPMLIPFILPSIFIIIETAMPNEFSTLILPSLIPVFSIQTPYQAFAYDGILDLIQDFRLAFNLFKRWNYSLKK